MWAPHGFDLSRRSFFATVAGVLGMGTNTVGGTKPPDSAGFVTQARTPGFYVTGVVTESQESDIFYIGVQFGLIAAPRTEPHRILRSKVGTRVRVHVESA